MNISSEDWAILEVWLEDNSFINWANQSDPTDTDKWEVYFNENPKQWRLGKAGKALVIGIPFKEIRQDDIQKADALEGLMDRLNDTSNIPVIALPSDTNKSQKSWYLAVCIAALITLTSSLAYLQLRNTEVNYSTHFGEQQVIELPDESIVTLNANSKLKYYSQSPRKMWLDGEAFFEVKKKPETNSNFLVFTPDLTVTVLGTTFNVNTRNDQTKVFLEEGKVNIATDEVNSKAIEMDPGDLVTYSKRRKKLKEKKNNASVLENASWKDGTLIFNNTTLYKALYEIEDIYGIQFVWQSERLKEKLISGGVPIKDLETTLHILKEVYGNKIEKKGNRYFITEKSN